MNRLLPLALLLLGATLLLPGCKPKPAGNSLDALDNSLVDGNVTGGDATGLRTAIRVDPARAGQPAPAAPHDDCLTRFGAGLEYGPGWTAKLPPEFPLPAGARVTEAAGHDSGCTVRAASFTLPGDQAHALAAYAALAAKAGYTANRQMRDATPMLTGTKGKATFYAFANPAVNGATPVDFLWTRPD